MSLLDAARTTTNLQRSVKEINAGWLFYIMLLTQQPVKLPDLECRLDYVLVRVELHLVTIDSVVNLTVQ